MFIVGLTGGIATGKSTVSKILAEKYGVPVIDSDLVARKGKDGYLHGDSKMLCTETTAIASVHSC